MRATVSATWLPILRVLLVAVAAQPAAAALIHDTSIRYPVIGGVIAAVEGAVIAWASKRSAPTSTTAPPPR